MSGNVDNEGVTIKKNDGRDRAGRTSTGQVSRGLTNVSTGCLFSVLGATECGVTISQYIEATCDLVPGIFHMPREVSSSLQ